MSTTDAEVRGVEARITRALLGTVRSLATGEDRDRKGRDWAAARPYLRECLATHAVAGGCLEELLGDAEFLVHAEPGPLLGALGGAQMLDDGARRAAAVYRFSAPFDGCTALDGSADPGGRRQVLNLNAIRFDDPELAESVGAGLAWQVRWATGVQATSALEATMPRQQDPVNALACTTVGGRPIVVTGGPNGEIRAWNLSGRSERPALQKADGYAFTAMAATLPGGRPVVLAGHEVVVVGSEDGRVRVWRLDTRDVLPLLRDPESVGAVACAELEGQLVAVTGHRDGSVRVWDLTRDPVQALLPAWDAGPKVLALGCTQLDDGSLAVVISTPDRLCLWELGTPRLEPLDPPSDDPDHGPVTAVACARAQDRAQAVAGYRDGSVACWDLQDRRQTWSKSGNEGQVSGVACTKAGDTRVAVIGHTQGQAGRVVLRDLGTGQLLGRMSAHRGEVRALDCATVDGRPVAVTGGGDRAVRVWDLEAAVGDWFRLRRGHSGLVRAVACTTVDRVPVVVSAGDDASVRVWDLDSGQEECTFGGHTGPVRAVACTEVDRMPVACTEVDRTPVAVSVGDDGLLRVWDLHNKQPWHGLADLADHEGKVLSVDCTVIDNVPVAVTVDADHVMRVWNLPDGGLRWQRHVGSAEAVACVSCDGVPFAWTVGRDASVREWDLKMKQWQRRIADPSPGAVSAVACARVGLEATAVAFTGKASGSVGMWCVATDRPYRTVPQRARHAGAVSAIACGAVNGRELVVSAGTDRVLRIWEPRAGEPVTVVHLPEAAQAVAVGSGRVVVGMGQEVVVLDEDSTLLSS